MPLERHLEERSARAPVLQRTEPVESPGFRVAVPVRRPSGLAGLAERCYWPGWRSALLLAGLAVLSCCTHQLHGERSWTVRCWQRTVSSDAGPPESGTFIPGAGRPLGEECASAGRPWLAALRASVLRRQPALLRSPQSPSVSLFFLVYPP